MTATGAATIRSETPRRRNSRGLARSSRITSSFRRCCRAAPLPNHLGARGSRARSALDVEPGAARACVAEALAPGGDRLPGARDRDFAVVAVDLAEAVRVDVARSSGWGVADLYRGRPVHASIGRASVPDVPGVGIVPGGLHVPDPNVPAARRGKARPSGVLARDGEWHPDAPR